MKNGIACWQLCEMRCEVQPLVAPGGLPVSASWVYWRVELDYVMRVIVRLHPGGKVQFLLEDPMEPGCPSAFEPRPEEVCFALGRARGVSGAVFDARQRTCGRPAQTIV